MAPYSSTARCASGGSVTKRLQRLSFGIRSSGAIGRKLFTRLNTMSYLLKYVTVLVQAIAITGKSHFPFGGGLTGGTIRDAIRADLLARSKHPAQGGLPVSP